MQFKIHGSGKKNLHGDGIAIWYTKDRLHSGNTGSARELQLVRRKFTWLNVSCGVWIYPEFSAATSWLN